MRYVSILARVPRPAGALDGEPACGDSQEAEPVTDREEFFVIVTAAGAALDVAADPSARKAIKCAHDVGTDLAAPLRA